jgi:hypothetical protein
LWFIRAKEILGVCLAAVAMGSLASAQQPAPDSDARSLAQSVEELREQVQELRATVAEMKSEASQYRAETDQLRQELHQLRNTPENRVATGTEGQGANPGNTSVDQRVSSLEDTTQVLESEVRTQYQTKVESSSQYRVRLSGLALFNLFANNGGVDNLDFPTYATPSNTYGSRAAFGATLRQSQLGVEVFGPQVGGGKLSGQIEFDFAGGFPPAEVNGINTGIVRMRTASMRLDWSQTSVIAGQDNLFISPLSPTSYASLAVPSMGYSGNLWAWTPQLRIEHKFLMDGNQHFLLQAGILDNVTGEPTTGSHRHAQAGESSGQPAYALRASWNKEVKGRPLAIGASGYYSRQSWSPSWKVDGWAGAADWRFPIVSKLELSGEFYRGRAIGGIGGGIGQTILFKANPMSTGPEFRGLNSTGGWSQLKFLASPKLEFNGAFGIDNPFAADVRAFEYPVSYYASVLTGNRSQMANFIYHPRSDLLFSGEYRHLHTSQVGPLSSSDQVNLMMGVLF